MGGDTAYDRMRRYLGQMAPRGRGVWRITYIGNNRYRCNLIDFGPTGQRVLAKSLCIVLLKSGGFEILPNRRRESLAGVRPY